MKIYIDDEFKCHTQAADDRTAVETDFFDGMCSAYIEGYRYVPAGQTWTREDGTVFTGEMVSPWKPLAELDAIQRAYIEQQNAELLDAMATMVEDVYTSDLSLME